MKGYIVYRHIAPNNKMYVGVTKLKPERRWKNGNGYAHNQYFSYAIQKYGWDNLKHEILLEGLTKRQAECAERLFIGYWNLTNSDFGYNCEHGGSLGKDVSLETRNKMSVSHVGKTHTEESKVKMSLNHVDVRGKNNPMYGKHHSESTKAKISNATCGKNNGMYGRRGELCPMYGRPVSLETRKKMSERKPKKGVICLDMYTNDFIAEYVSMREAERITGVKQGSISNCCNGKTKTGGGYIWKYA